MTSQIYYAKPSITSVELGYAVDAVEHGWGDRGTHFISQFETELCQSFGCRFAIATSSCTGALHMGLKALGIGSGDEVILADINWIATAAPITYLGARPVFVDILPDTWCIDPAAVIKAITRRTRAIIATHLYGNLCDMHRLTEIGRQKGIPIIEDAAEAIGASYAQKHAGTIGKFGVFSFHASKTITTGGEGGALVTDDAVLYQRVRTLGEHGRDCRVPVSLRQFWPEMIGFKYKMTNVQAAIGCAQLNRLQELVGRKAEIFFQYNAALETRPIQMNPGPSKIAVPGYWMPTVVVNKDILFDRDRLFRKFKENNIDARVFFWPLTMLPPFKDDAGAEKNPVAYSIHERAFNLPSYHDITTEEIERVAKTVRGGV